MDQAAPDTVDLCPCAPENRHGGKARAVRHLCLVSLVFLVGCAGDQGSREPAATPVAGTTPDKLMVVDCLLPGMLIQQGQFHTWMTPRQPIRTTAQQCEFQGGEYVSYDRANFATALRTWQEAADRGDPAAQTYVGEIYEKGLGIPPDPARAMVWYQKAADQGYPRALTNLAYLYEKGLGVERNPQKAMNLYRRAVGLPETVALTQSADPEELRAIRQQLEAAHRKLQESDAQLRSMQATAAEKEEKVKRLEEELKKLQNKTGTDGAALQQLRDDLNRSKEEINRLKSQAANAQGDAQQLRRMQDLVAEKEEKAKRLEADLKNLQDKSGNEGATLRQLRDELNHSKEDINRFKQQAATAEQQAKQYHDEVTKLEAKMLVTAPSAPAQGLKLGTFYALVIGNQSYQNHTPLKTALNDAKRVGAVLEKKYRFKTEVLLDANYTTMVRALYDVANRLGENDNLLIYYAGHGQLRKEISRGYWLPIDAGKQLDGTWVSTGEINDTLGISKAKHILVVVDSCYAGALVRGAEEVRTPANPKDESAVNEWMRRLAQAKSRNALTSGGLTPVLDNDGSGSNSIFAKALLEILENNGEVLSGYSVWAKVSPRVAAAAGRLNIPQTPEYNAMFGVGHDSGEFFFAPAGKGTAKDIGPPRVWTAGLSAATMEERRCVMLQPSLAITYFQIFRELASTIWPCRGPVAAHG